VYLIFALIDSLAFAPIAGAEDSYDTGAVRKPDGQYSASDIAEAEVPLLLCAVPCVFGDNALRVRKGVLR
jgi:hypothetical protein